ncbi:MAG: DUF5049 domain-containing protein [Armatimonadota bacterium]
MKRDKVQIPQKVMEGIEAVRLSGKTNMLDVPMVIHLALEMGFPQAAVWVYEYQNLYAQGVFTGFVTAESVENSELGKPKEIIDWDGGDEECVDR